jgi:hypothetical protein
MRLTTDTPKNNFEMALNLFYVKDKEVWVRGYGKNGADISLFDLSRDLTRWNCPYVDLDISDDSFSMMMAEWLWEDVESFEHVLALLYQAAWVCAELREHLKQFEDTGWTPEMLHKLGENAGHLWDFAQAAENMTVGRLKELAEADKDGRVVILPCKVGDTVWFKTYKNNARDCIGVQPHEVTRISASIIVPGEIVDIGIPVDQIGVRVFLSETEAVAADAKPPAGNSILEV